MCNVAYYGQDVKKEELDTVIEVEKHYFYRLKSILFMKFPTSATVFKKYVEDRSGYEEHKDLIKQNFDALLQLILQAQLTTSHLAIMHAFFTNKLNKGDWFKNKYHIYLYLRRNKANLIGYNSQKKWRKVGLRFSKDQLNKDITELVANGIISFDAPLTDDSLSNYQVGHTFVPILLRYYLRPPKKALQRFLYFLSKCLIQAINSDNQISKKNEREKKSRQRLGYLHLLDGDTIPSYNFYLGLDVPVHLQTIGLKAAKSHVKKVTTQNIDDCYTNMCYSFFNRIEQIGLNTALKGKETPDTFLNLKKPKQESILLKLMKIHDKEKLVPDASSANRIEIRFLGEDLLDMNRIIQSNKWKTWLDDIVNDYEQDITMNHKLLVDKGLIRNLKELNPKGKVWGGGLEPP